MDSSIVSSILKTVSSVVLPPPVSDEVMPAFGGTKAMEPSLPELKSAVSEEIEIVPDIHIPDESASNQESLADEEYLDVKLRHFSNIHYQVINTPAVKLCNVHMILYLTTRAKNNIRRNVLEFAGYNFDESSSEYRCRKNLMEQMSLEDIKQVADVLCVSQFIVNESKESLINAILKFLLKPSAILKSRTIMPTTSPAPSPLNLVSVTKKKARNASKTPQSSNAMPAILASKMETILNSNRACPPESSVINGLSSSNVFVPSKRGKSIECEARLKIVDVYSRLRKEHPEESINQIVDKVSQLTGVSKRTVYRLRTEKVQLNPGYTPGKKRPNAVGKRKRFAKYDSSALDNIRKKIQDFINENEFTSLDKALKRLNDDREIFQKTISRTTFYRIIKDLGISFEKPEKKKIMRVPLKS